MDSRGGISPGRGRVAAVLERRRPDHIVYAPNYWQWFEHQRNHARLPPEAAHCRSQLDLIRHLGLDVFSRNLYSDPQRYWFGGLADVVWNGVEAEKKESVEDGDRVIEWTYRTRAGALNERLRHVFRESTVVQERFLIEDPVRQAAAFAEFLSARRWRFDAGRYARIDAEVGADGLVVAGELFSPLKMLHLALGPVNTTYFLEDHPKPAAELMALHEAAQLDLVRQMAEAGVRVMMSMDNLDSAFHTPSYVERCSASFYEQAARTCHAHGSLLFIHACGHVQHNLKRIASYGVDGLEGVPFPPLGDVALDEAMRLSGDRFLITGGITAHETDRLRTREAVDAYVRELFRRMEPFAHRFILSASCATPYNAPWETLRHFRDAWRLHGALRD